jgi:hypothetical protein
VDSSTPHNVSWNLPLHFSESASTHIALDNVIFANAAFPINSNNNTILFQENNSTAATYTATITAGVYTGATLATEIKTRMDAATGNAYTYTVSFNAATKKLTISTTNFRILLSSTAKKVIGLGVSEQSFAASQALPNPVRLDGSQYVSVVSNFTSKNISSGYSQSILLRVPLDVSYGELVNYSSQTDDYNLVDVSELSSISFRLYGDDGLPYELPSNCPVNYTLKLIIK